MKKLLIIITTLILISCGQTKYTVLPVGSNIKVQAIADVNAIEHYQVGDTVIIAKYNTEYSSDYYVIINTHEISNVKSQNYMYTPPVYTKATIVKIF